MQFSPTISQLIEALRCLPGVGSKSAQRMALHLLERNRTGARQLASALTLAMDKVNHCESCNTLTEDPLCQLCRSSSRDDTVLCIVENPADIPAIESSASYTGCYYVLMGHLSPLDGIGPVELKLDRLEQKLQNGQFDEVILATNPTIEGDATANYIADIAKGLGIKASRIAHGIPMGGELEFVDGSTIAQSFSGRRAL